jgi:WD40 repeat protein
MKQFKKSAIMYKFYRFNIPSKGPLNLLFLSAFVVCVSSTSVSAAVSVAAAPNLCSGIFGEHSAMDAHGKFPILSKPAINFNPAEVVSRIDNLIELQQRIQMKSFNSNNEFIQALAFFERETKGLMLLDPSYQQLYKERFFEISQSVKKKQAKADQLKKDDQSARNKAINGTELFKPKERFDITHKDIVRSATFSPDGKYVVTASNDGTAKIFEVATKKELFEITHDSVVNSAEFSPDGKYIVTASDDGIAKVYEVATQTKIFSILHDKYKFVTSATFSPDSKFVVTVSDDKTAKIYDVKTHKKLFSISHEKYVVSAIFSSDSKFVLTASGDGRSKVYEVATKTELLSIQHKDLVSSAVFSADSKYVVTASGDNTVKVYEVGQKKGFYSKIFGLKKALFTILHNDPVDSAVFSPDGKYVVSASTDKTAKIYDVESQTEIFSIEHLDPVLGAVFSPDSKYVVTASADGTANVYEVASHKKIFSIEHRGHVLVATFSPDSRYVVTASYDKTAKITQLYQSLDGE